MSTPPHVPDESVPTASTPVAGPNQPVSPALAKTPLRERSFSFTALVAGVAAGLLVGVVGFAAADAMCGDDDGGHGRDGRHGHHGFKDGGQGRHGDFRQNHQDRQDRRTGQEPGRFGQAPEQPKDQMQPEPGYPMPGAPDVDGDAPVESPVDPMLPPEAPTR